MPIAVIILLYLVGALILLLLFMVLFILLVPFRYRLGGGYDSRPWFIFNIRCSPAFIFDGKWDEAENKELKARIILFGIPIKIDLQNMGKKDQTEEKKKNNKKGTAVITSILDNEFRKRGIVLIRDLFRILKPEYFSIRGKIGFEEPYYTGYLAALSNGVRYCCHNAFIDLEPVFEEEYLAVEATLRGQILLGLILVKIGWFFFINRIRTFSVRSGGERLSPATSID